MAELNSLSALLADANLSAYYRLESDGTDHSAQSNDLTVTGATFVAAKYGNGLQIDNSGEKAVKASSATNLFSGLGDFSIAFWMKRLGTFTGGSSLSSLLLLASAGSGTVRIAKGGSDNQIRLYVERAGDSFSTAIGVDTDFAHFAFTRSNSGVTLKTYKNGALITTDTVTGRDIDTPDVISINENNPINWNSVLDDFTIWKRELTLQEVRSLATDATRGEMFMSF